MCRGAAGGARRAITGPGSEPRLKAIIAQQPQHILADAGRGGTDKEAPAGTQIGEAADRIMERAIGGEKDRVDREVAPRRIGRPVGVEGYARAAAVSFDVAAQRCDLEMSRRHDCGYRAVRET